MPHIIKSKMELDEWMKDPLIDPNNMEE